MGIGSMKQITEKIAEFVSSITYDDIPEAVTKQAESLIVDTIGCMYSGSIADGIREIVEYLSEFDSSRDAGVFGFTNRLSIQNAALVNSAAAHARDYDDTHDEAVNHASVTTLPALIAVSQYISKRAQEGGREHDPLNGKAFVAAFCAALEIANRIALAFIPYLGTGWLPTTLSGPFGSACGVAKLLGLPAVTIQKAVGFAYTQIHGNRQALIEGTLAKRIQPAFSTVAGIHAAFLAKAGLSSPVKVFTGDYGIANLYTDGKIDSKRLTDNLGTVWETGNISIKPYPSCRCTHPVIDAALELKKTYQVDYRDIISGHIFLPPASMGQIGQPFCLGLNPTVDAQFSAQYTSALCFVKGKPETADFAAKTVVERTEIHSLAGRFTVTEFDSANRGLTPIKMQIIMKNGKTHEISIETITGSRDKPFSELMLIDKFRENLTAAGLSDDRINRIILLLKTIRDTEDIGAIFGLIQREYREI